MNSTPPVFNEAPVASPLVDEIFADKHLHSRLVEACMRGVSSSDSDPLDFCPIAWPNLKRVFYIFNAVARIFHEMGFKHDKGGIAQHVEKICPVTKKSVRIVLSSGRKLEEETAHIFQVNKKGPHTVSYVVNNWQLSDNNPILFSIEDLMNEGVVVKVPYDRGAFETALLFYSYRDNGVGQDITVYLAKPISMDKSGTLIECDRAVKLGVFTAAGPDADFDFSVFPTVEESPVFTPIIEPIEVVNGHE